MAEHEPLHIGIIGAGAAGLKAAAHLRERLGAANAKIDITILEARARIGGRVLSTDLDGGSLINSASFRGPEELKGGEQHDVLEFGPQWAHDVAHEEHGLRELLEPSKLELSEPEFFTNSQDYVLTFTADEFPDVKEKDVADLDTWMEMIVADTVLRYDIMHNHMSDSEQQLAGTPSSQLMAENKDHRFYPNLYLSSSFGNKFY